MAIEHDLQNFINQRITITASDVIQLLASYNSSNIYLYDLAAQLGFGDFLNGHKISSVNAGIAKIIEMETREGAGLSLLGWVNGQSSNMESSVITAFTTPTGLAQMTFSLQLIHKPFNSSNRLVVQVPNISVLSESLAFTPSLSTLTSVLPFIPDHVAVMASSTSQEAIDFTKLAYSVEDKHVIHIFDQYASSRELGQACLPEVNAKDPQPFKQMLSSLKYGYFSYTGPAIPESVIILLNGPLAAYIKSLCLPEGSKFGVLTVNVIKPWNEEALRIALPSGAKKVYVIDDVQEQSSPGYIHGEVFSSLLETEVAIESIKLTPSKLQEFISNPFKLRELLAAFIPTSSQDNISQNNKKLLFYSSPSSALHDLPSMIESTFASSKSVKARVHAEYDVLSKPGGTALHRMLLTPANVSSDGTSILPFLVPLEPVEGQADFIAVSDQALLKSHHLLRAAKKGSSVLLFTDWLPHEVSANLPASVVKDIVDKELNLYTLDTKAVSNQVEDARIALVEQAVAYMAFMRLYLGGRSTQQLVETLAESVFQSMLKGVYGTISKGVWTALREVSLSDVIETEGGEEAPLQCFEFNAISTPKEGEFKEMSPNATLGTWMDAAKYLLFHEAYTLPEERVVTGAPATVRPDIPEDHYVVTCTVNRRLTPLAYERNVFHLEFDTSGTGLNYAIGEALGVHGWNDTEDVLNFCKWYGIDPNATISLPVPESGGKKFHRRTVFQAFQQQIDIFGQPPKSFYSSLAEFATKREDRLALQFIAAPEGASTFKKLAEKDTVTFADVLEKFESARPGVEVLAELVGDIKPRHYSIASAQSAVGDQVDLLVVTVDWMTPSGSARYGQCTRYLAGLEPGQKVTVSIKPSVMKLPPDDMQPIIMAGLGTGAAPFRAFMQHRALLASKNIRAGPLIYYFGSRHRSEEYLYGEEIEAYLASSVITHAGLAFSRDQKQKVYIQHKMKSDGDMLIQMLRKDNGVFYLCGPTWPVPDVYETLVTSFMKLEGGDDSSAAAYFESLKEEERYVLEVY